jgi:hypothetical protein
MACNDLWKLSVQSLLSPLITHPLILFYFILFLGLSSDFIKVFLILYCAEDGRCRWKKVDCEVRPGARYHHTAVVVGNAMLVWAGLSDTSPLNDMWSFSFGTPYFIFIFIFILENRQSILFLLKWDLIWYVVSRFYQ